jgi:hypothetical protein
MEPEIQAAIIQVAGLWVIEAARMSHLNRVEMEKDLPSSFKETYERLAAIVANLPNS